MKFESPYVTDGPWLRGNLHTHTSNSDGSRDPQVVVDDYAGRGYDFLALSDHDLVTPVRELDARGMVLIAANEITAGGPHLLHVGARERIAPNPDRQAVLDAIGASGGLAILNHPKWHSNYNHFPQDLLESLSGHVGIEIYNGVIERLAGSAFALDRWDQLLTKGQRVWGFANDDSHLPGDVELGWNVVRATDRSAPAILAALRRGEFYASTGVTLETIELTATGVRLAATEEVQWEVRTSGSRRIFAEQGTACEWVPPEGSRLPFVRFEAHGARGRSAWTQPLFVAEG